MKRPRHRFHDPEWVENYAATVTQRRPERIDVFQYMVQQIRDLDGEAPSVIELAPGPGLLAETLLEGIPQMQYTGVDFSKEMIRAAERRTAAHRRQCRFICRDLRSKTWHRGLKPEGADAIVSSQALHDLGEMQHVEKVYTRSRSLLKPGGLLLNADLVLSPDHENETEGGRLKAHHHLRLLTTLGYDRVECPLDFTTYVCIQAYRPE